MTEFEICPRVQLAFYDTGRYNLVLKNVFELKTLNKRTKTTQKKSIADHGKYQMVLLFW